MRRRQCGIDKKDLQAARKNGVKHRHNYKSNGNLTFRYTYKDIVHVVDGVTDQEVTCYAVPLKLDMNTRKRRRGSALIWTRGRQTLSSLSTPPAV
jgi:hypothetical protein